MPKNPDIKKVLVIGSGPIIIGQAAEFDYAGTQACRSLKEEGVEVLLLNSNPATIMTDKDIADKVYIEPLTTEVVEQLIMKEKPDSVLPTLGGQAGLNLAMELEEAGILAKNNVRLIGTTPLTIKKAEDREMFKETMEKINEPVAPSEIVESLEDGLAVAEKIGYPVVLRPAYTLGGSGGGIAENPEQCAEILENGLRLSRVGQVLVERCIAGWKEIEYEVMRDGAGNVITVCNMENIDPVGVHTGDSIVVAPSQTLGDKEYQMLRTSALKIITELGITGGCNVQYALNPNSFEYCVIEVNPRVSRSSALASKATGYPIAKVAAKIALGYTLDEIKNAVTKKTYASFEPMLDYVVVKMPRLPFDKFINASHSLGTQMKATGEVMSICTSFEGGLMKAIRSLEQHVDCLLSYDYSGLTSAELKEELNRVDDRRIWVIAEALRRGFSYDMIHEITKSVDQASNLSKELLAFSRQDTGVRLEPLNFTEEVRNAVSIVRQLAPAAITLKTEIAEEPLYVLGRRRMAEHILMNLCKNAFQAMEKTERKELWIRLTAKGNDAIRLQVSDTGCGIGDDAMQKIFEPFYTTKGSRQGTGLGLSVVQNMVTSVGGTICVESKAGEGTTFVIEIPQSGPEVEADGRKRLKHVQKIAIVSGEESAKTWKAAASHSRKTVDLYAHPAALIDRVQKDPSAYDLLIAEYTLPTMNGIELCEVVRRINPEIRLILIAEQGGADFEWYLNNGMIDRFMLKDEFAEEFAEMFEG